VKSDVDQPPVCAAPGCDNVLPAYAGRGRPRLYCSTGCRGAMTLRPDVLIVEVDHEGDETAGRPTGRVWLVRMRRGTTTVVVATELGRPSADHLAGQISGLIGGRRWPSGGASE
jgi:hypothetical protein